MFKKDSTVHVPLPTKDRDSEDDEIPLKVLYKRHKKSQKQIIIN
jgi:hypothetical protein